MVGRWRPHKLSTTKIWGSEFPWSPIKLHKGQSLKHEKVNKIFKSDFTQERVQASTRVERPRRSCGLCSGAGIGWEGNNRGDCCYQGKEEVPECHCSKGEIYLRGRIKFPALNNSEVLMELIQKSLFTSTQEKKCYQALTQQPDTSCNRYPAKYI